MTCVTITDLVTIDDEPRVMDIALAERLGMSRPRDIRGDLIRPNIDELSTLGGLRETPANPGAKGGRPSKAYYLNEAQALLICMFSRTPKAAEVRRQVIEVFMQWRAERQRAVAPPPAAAHPVVERSSPAHAFLSDLAAALDRVTVQPIWGREPFAASSAIFILRLALADTMGAGRPRLTPPPVAPSAQDALKFMDLAALGRFYNVRREEFAAACAVMDDNDDKAREWLCETTVTSRVSELEYIRDEAASRYPANERDRLERSRIIVDLASITDEAPDETLQLIHRR